MLKMHTTGFTYTSPEPTRVHVIPHQFNSKPSAVSLYVGGELVISEVICDENTVTVTTREDVTLEVICSFPVDIAEYHDTHENSPEFISALKEAMDEELEDESSEVMP